MKQFEEQKNRGRQGFGVFDRDCTRLVRATKEKKILGWLKNHPSKSLLFHHRFPTSTDNVKNACHPFSTKDFFATNYVLIHNGHVSNAKSLKVEHEKRGIVYHSEQKDGRFNDSEALLWDMALYLEGEQTELKAYGGIALICMALPADGRKHKRLYFARNASKPLVIRHTNKALLLSSEGKGQDIKPDTLYAYDYRSTKMTEKPFEIRQFKPYVAGEWDKTGQHYRGSVQAQNSGFRSNNPAYTPGSYADGNYTFDADEPDWDTMANYETYDEWLAAQPHPIRQSLSYPKPPEDYKAADKLTDDAVFHKDDRDMILLPDNEDYSYAAILRSEGPEIVLHLDDQPFNIRSMIADRAELYLEANDGNYLDAYTMLKADIKNYERQVADDLALNDDEDESLILELDVLTACRETLYTSPHWRTNLSIDPGYQDIVDDKKNEGFVRAAVKQAIDHAGKQNLLSSGK